MTSAATVTSTRGPSGRSPSPETSVDYEALFLSQLTVIDQVVTFVARRYRLTPDDTEDFRGTVYLRLIQDDYAAIRKFEGRSSLRTYLTVVIGRLLLDHRNSVWGKWRPSAQAQRGGEIAIQLEKLTLDGLSFEHACDVLESARRQAIDRRRLRALFDTFPRRTRRSFVGDDAIALLSAPDSDPETGLSRDARRAEVEAACRALARELHTLSPEDLRLLRLRFLEGRTIRDAIRQTRGADPLEVKAGYRQLRRLLDRLRRGLERRGVTRRDMLAMLGSADLTVPPVLNQATAGQTARAAEEASLPDVTFGAVLMAALRSEGTESSAAGCAP
jgi:DNA-directed RNA polymerase specialized sigma24 family protein